METNLVNNYDNPIFQSRPLKIVQSLTWIAMGLFTATGPCLAIEKVVSIWTENEGSSKANRVYSKIVSEKENIKSALDTWIQETSESSQKEHRITSKGIICDFIDNNDKSIFLSNMPITSLPKIFHFDCFQRLTSLYLMRNELITLPPMNNLHSLTYLCLTRNKIEVLPSGIFELKLLTHLYLSGNALKELSPEIGKLKKLVELRLDKNQLTRLPSEMSNLRSLKVLSVCDNNFNDNELTSISELIDKLPCLTLHPIDQTPINRGPIYKGFLYRILDNTRKEMGYLAGSLHITADSDYRLQSSMEIALRKVHAVVVEVNILELSDSLILKSRPNEAVEDKVLRMAYVNKKNIYQLETIELQMQMGKDLAAACHSDEEDLKKTIEECKAFVIQEDETQTDLLPGQEMLKKMIEAYKTGQKSSMKALCIIDNEIAQKIIFWDRNLEMANKIHEILQAEESTFILIGTGHLWGTKEEGKKGVVSLLRDKGWNIEKVVV